MDRFTNDGYQFEVTDAGPTDGQAVILLHGFPEDRHCWAKVTPALNEAGYRTLAFDQRGYSPGARPLDRQSYRLALLAGDVLALANQAGIDRFHLVGHDWGAALAWYMAAYHPQRLISLNVLSVAHAQVFLGSILRSRQVLHSWYIAFFQIPWLPERLLSLRGGALMAQGLTRNGLNADAAARYAQRATEPHGFTGPINWYRAMPSQLSDRLAKVDTPVLLMWGDQDKYVNRAAVEHCGDWVNGPYRFEELRGVSHWIPEEEPKRTSTLLIEHFGRV